LSGFLASLWAVKFGHQPRYLTSLPCSSGMMPPGLPKHLGCSPVFSIILLETPLGHVLP
jgi:hypothetical protein